MKFHEIWGNRYTCKYGFDTGLLFLTPSSEHKALTLPFIARFNYDEESNSSSV